MRVLFTVRGKRAIAGLLGLDEVMRIIDKWDRDAFVTVEDPKILRGGSFATREWKIVSPFGRPGSVGGGTRQGL